MEIDVATRKMMAAADQHARDERIEDMRGIVARCSTTKNTKSAPSQGKSTKKNSFSKRLRALAVNRCYLFAPFAVKDR